MTVRRVVKLGLALVVALALVVIVALAGGGWYVSGILKTDGFLVNRSDPEPDLVVAAIGDDQVTLEITPQTDEDGDWRRDGIWGLVPDVGYSQVGAVLEITDQHVVREFFPLSGDLEVGDMVRLEHYAFPDDPLTAFGLAYEEVRYSSPLGDFPAWFLDASGDIWAIFVHGKGGTRREALRMLPGAVELGFPSLVITYRNDEEAPKSASGLYGYGQTEWQDLEGAASYAADHGASGFVLVGYSMGGAIVLNFLYRSPLAERVRGAILDAPMVDFNATVDLGGRERGLPRPFVVASKAIAQLRFGVDWGKLDYLKRADELSAPILLLHGDADKKVPVRTSDALAKARPDIVQYVRFDDTGHVLGWNTNRAAYEAAVTGFLQGLSE